MPSETPSLPGLPITDGLLAKSTSMDAAINYATPTIPLRIRRIPWWKRAMDIGVSLVLLPLLLPLMTIIAIYIKLVSRGPVLFCQQRLGYGTQPFTILKFRTMHQSDSALVTDEHRRYVAELVGKNTPANKPSIAKRLIPGARFLRDTSLDELPQIFNVLGGSMSLVGPRPDVLKASDYTPKQLRRFEVLPGITGLWQVSGKNNLTFDQMIDLDIHYVDHLSIRLDLWILFKTIAVVLRRGNK
jgi:lipopolysaccharide/colanic/teichoic acid biosynthesis glycosyltransferase